MYWQPKWKPLFYRIDSTIAEARGMVEATRLCKLQQIILEGDASQVVKALQVRESDDGPFRSLI